MGKRPRQLRAIFSSTIVLLFLAFFFSATRAAFAWKEQMHKEQLTLNAIKLVRKFAGQKYSPEIWTTFFLPLLQGAYDEDFPCDMDFSGIESGRIFRALIRANNHYRHALSGRGLTDSPWAGLGDRDVDTLTWAKENSSFSRAEEFGKDVWDYKRLGWTPGDLDDGNMSWPKAIDRYGYTDQAKALAYYTLGFLCHLLQDMGCPEHVHDDPHGASGFTGFEWWVYFKWNILERSLGDLAIKTFPQVEDAKKMETYFKNLCLIGYSIDRFSGGSLSTAIGEVNPESDLGRMFDITYDREHSVWKMANKGNTPPILIRTPNLASISEEGSSNLFNPDFDWSEAKYRKSPLWTKGHDEGEFWPTSVEIPGSEFGNDAEGYYYIELSGEFPGQPLGEFADPIRSLYPKAFLPTPLPEVANEIPRWREENANGKHLYTLMGEKIFGPVIAYTAGLITHYFDIVNHPPYVTDVKAVQGGNTYLARWIDNKRKRYISNSILDVISRDPDILQESKPFVPGRVILDVTFSEPVRDVTVKLGNTVLSGNLSQDGTVWSALAVIEESGPETETRKISIAASDLNNHYGNAGAALDSDPRSPARRIMPSEDQYEWIGYEQGEDANYDIRIKREKRTDEQAQPGVPPAVGVPPAAVNCPSISGTWTRTGGGIWNIQGGASISWIGKSAEQPFPDGKWFFYQEFKGSMIDNCYFQGKWEDIPDKSIMKNKGTIVLQIVSPNLIRSVSEYKGYKTDPPGLLELKR